MSLNITGGVPYVGAHGVAPPLLASGSRRDVVIVEIDTTAVPVRTSVLEPDDLTAFSVVIRRAEHAWIAPKDLLVLVGPERAGDPAWRTRFEAMVDFARDHGWVDADGRVRAHTLTNST